MNPKVETLLPQAKLHKPSLLFTSLNTFTSLTIFNSFTTSSQHFFDHYRIFSTYSAFLNQSIFIKVTISATSVSEHFDDSKPTSFADVTRLLSHEPIFPKGSLSVKIEGGSCL